MVAWVANFIIIPSIGFIIASLFLSGQPLFFTGLLIYFMAPCTDWFLGFTRLAKGNTSLGAVLLPINMITQLLLYPFYLFVFTNINTEISTTSIGGTVFQWFIIPFIGATLLHVFLRALVSPAWFERLLTLIAQLVPIIIAILVLEIFSSNIAVILAHVTTFVTILCAVFIFFIATYLLSEGLSRYFVLAYREHALLTMTTAARNAPLMLGITAVALPDQPLLYAALIIGMLVEFPHLTVLKHILLSKHYPKMT